MDVHVFLFSDMLLLCKNLTKIKGDKGSSGGTGGWSNEQGKEREVGGEGKWNVRMQDGRNGCGHKRGGEAG